MEPEFLRVPQIYALTGIKRGTLYSLISKGIIQSVSLKQPGCRQGVRLVSWKSLKNYLHTLAEQQNPEAA